MAEDYSKIFATGGPISQPTDTQYLEGFGFLGQAPPPLGLFNYLFQNIDLKILTLSNSVGFNLWKASSAYVVGDVIFSATASKYKRFECVVAGTSGLSEPNWPSVGQMIIDGSAKWIVDDVRDGTPVGRSVLEHRATPRAGYLGKNGQLVNRSDYPRLWQFAQDSGLLVTDSAWSNGKYGCFSSGNGSTTFRIPDGRGEFERGADDGRGVDSAREIGSWQKGTIVPIDTGTTASPSAGVYGVRSYIAGNPTGDGDIARSDAGADAINNADYPNIYLTGISADTSISDLTGNNVGARSGAMRPRNIALLSCIKY